MLKTTEDRQRNNHTIQQSLLKSWINDDVDVNVINLDESKIHLRKYYNPSLHNIRDSLFNNRRGIKTEKIFSNKYIFNLTEENIDGYGKKVFEIEKEFLRNFKHDDFFNLDSLYNYFALQLTRSEANLITAYRRFCAWFGKVSDVVTYQQFKIFYNATLPPQFSYLYKDFIDNDYQGYHMEVTYLFDDKGNTISPFFWICEANTFCLSKIKESKGLIPELDNFNLNKIYVCLVSNRELVFLYSPDVSAEDIKEISLIIAVNWNKLALKFVCSTLIIPQDCILTLSRNILYLINSTSMQYLNCGNDLSNLKNIQRKYEPLIFEEYRSVT